MIADATSLGYEEKAGNRDRYTLVKEKSDIVYVIFKPKENVLTQVSQSSIDFYKKHKCSIHASIPWRETIHKKVYKLSGKERRNVRRIIVTDKQGNEQEHKSMKTFYLYLQKVLGRDINLNKMYQYCGKGKIIYGHYIRYKEKATQNE